MRGEKNQGVVNISIRFKMNSKTRFEVKFHRGRFDVEALSYGTSEVGKGHSTICACIQGRSVGLRA